VGETSNVILGVAFFSARRLIAVWKFAIFDQYLASSSHSYSYCRTEALERHHFQWPWTTPKPDYEITPLFDAEYL